MSTPVTVPQTFFPTPLAEQAPEPKPVQRPVSFALWQLGIGLRTSWIGDAGFDPFASSDALNHFSIFGTRTLVLRGPAALAVGVTYEAGGRESTARGAPSRIDVDRFGGILEGRYHFSRDLYALAKTVPHALRVSSAIEDQSSPATLQQTDWRFGLDATLGLAWNAPRMLGAGNPLPEFWLQAEVGYGFSTRKDMKLKPDLDESDPRSTMTLNMGSQSLRGVMMRVSAAIAF